MSEPRLQIQHEAARRPDGVAREEPSKVDHVHEVGEILPMDLVFSRGTSRCLALRGSAPMNQDVNVERTSQQTNLC